MYQGEKFYLMIKETFTNNFIEDICREFGIEGDFKYFETLTNGHINTSFRVYFYRDGEMKDYCLQRINSYVFKKPQAVMENISNVTEYIRDKIKATGVTAKRAVLHFQSATSGKYYYVGPNGGFWRCSRYIDGSETYNETDNLGIIEETGRAFGDFQLKLADFPVKKLNITIPHFHNTIMRYEAFEEAVKNDEARRAGGVEAEIEQYRALEETATEMYKMQRRGELPLKVTHNDTKCNNVLFDKITGEYLCVIDLDTVMPGLVGFDFGDAIRFIANSTGEDEKDLARVGLDLDKFEAFSKGFAGKLKDVMTPAEKDTLALGALTMTTECGLRFLTDYLNGDVYFKTAYPEHNLDRARCQLALAKDMILKYDKMKAIVGKYAD